MDTIERFPKAKKELKALLEQVEQDSDVLAVILFGSAARNELHEHSDIDICLVLQPKQWGVEELAQKRLEYLHFDLDIKLFQQLPLYVRSRVLREGCVLFVKDEDKLYELAIRTAKEFEDFKHIYRDYLEAVAVIDRERILSKMAELDSYLSELAQIAPSSFEEYVRSIEKRRACERLLQISVEAVIDICAMLVQGFRLGLPSEEDDIFEKLVRAAVISDEMAKTLRRMKGLRNILVHEYGRVDDRIVFEVITNRLSDFEAFKCEVLKTLQKLQP